MALKNSRHFTSAVPSYFRNSVLYAPESGSRYGGTTVGKNCPTATVTLTGTLGNSNTRLPTLSPPLRVQNSFRCKKHAADGLRAQSRERRSSDDSSRRASCDGNSLESAQIRRVLIHHWHTSFIDLISLDSNGEAGTDMINHVEQQSIAFNILAFINCINYEKIE